MSRASSCIRLGILLVSFAFAMELLLPLRPLLVAYLPAWLRSPKGGPMQPWQVHTVLALMGLMGGRLVLVGLRQRRWCARGGRSIEAAHAAALTRLGSSRFDALCEADQVLVAIWGLEADVNTGGFARYFFNSSGDLACFAERALRLVGANRMADIMAQAIARFGSQGVPRERDERQRWLGAMRTEHETPFADLDRQFCGYPDDLAALVAAYLRRVAV